MAPDPGAIRTVGCNLAKLVPDATVVADIQTAVDRAHSATVQACILLNVHIRRCLDANLPVVHVFDGNWIVKAFYEVTEGDGTPQRDPELIRSAELLPDIDRVSRRGMKQLLQANANVIATVAHNNVWMHFRKRLLDHVKRCHVWSKEQYAALSSEERAQRRIDLFRAVDDLCAPPTRPPKSSYTLQTWVRAERQRLGIDDAVGVEGQAASLPFEEEGGQLPANHADDVARSGGGRREGDGALPIAALDGAKACPV